MICRGHFLRLAGCEASRISDAMFIAAAQALAAAVSDDDPAENAIYPPPTQIRSVSLAIARAVAEQAYEEGVAKLPRPADLRAYLASLMYLPNY